MPQPLGKQYNADSAFRDLTRPAILKHTGVVIEPIRYSKPLARQVRVGKMSLYAKQPCTHACMRQSAHALVHGVHGQEHHNAPQQLCAQTLDIEHWIGHGNRGSPNGSCGPHKIGASDSK